MASDDTFGSDDSVGERSDVERPNDIYEETRTERRPDESTNETTEPAAGERKRRVVRSDPAAARCGRWGDEQWR